jgi:hypothetical protein
MRVISGLIGRDRAHTDAHRMPGMIRDVKQFLQMQIAMPHPQHHTRSTTALEEQ